MDFCRSLDDSLKRLGIINLLQLHKANASVLLSNDYHRACRYAASCGVVSFGASVSDLPSGLMACCKGVHSFVQFPLNRQRRELLPLLSATISNGLTPIINRPFDTGKLIPNGTLSSGSHDSENASIEAFSYIISQCCSCVILTGTKCLPHLEANVHDFDTSLDTWRREVQSTPPVKSRDHKVSCLGLLQNGLDETMSSSLAFIESHPTVTKRACNWSVPNHITLRQHLA